MEDFSMEKIKLAKEITDLPVKKIWSRERYASIGNQIC